MTSASDLEKGSVLASAMHLLLTVGGLISVFANQGSPWVWVLFPAYLLPFVLWFVGTDEFVRQHAGNAIKFVFVMVGVAIVGMVLLLVAAESGDFPLSSWQVTALLENESFLIVVITVCVMIHDNSSESPLFLWVAIPAAIYAYCLVFSPLGRAYRASRGKRSDYFD